MVGNLSIWIHRYSNHVYHTKPLLIFPFVVVPEIGHGCIQKYDTHIDIDRNQIIGIHICIYIYSHVPLYIRYIYISLILNIYSIYIHYYDLPVQFWWGLRNWHSRDQLWVLKSNFPRELTSQEPTETDIRLMEGLMEEFPNKPPGMYNTLVNNGICSYLVKLDFWTINSTWKCMVRKTTFILGINP